MNTKSVQSNCPVVELAKLPKKLYNIHYSGQYYGVVEARTQPEAFKKARNKYGSHIFKDVNLLEVTSV